MDNSLKGTYHITNLRLVECLRFFQVIGARLQPEIWTIQTLKLTNLATSVILGNPHLLHMQDITRVSECKACPRRLSKANHCISNAGGRPSTVSFAYFPTGCVIASSADKVASAASCLQVQNGLFRHGRDHRLMLPIRIGKVQARPCIG